MTAHVRLTDAASLIFPVIINYLLIFLLQHAQMIPQSNGNLAECYTLTPLRKFHPRNLEKKH